MLLLIYVSIFLMNKCIHLQRNGCLAYFFTLSLVGFAGRKDPYCARPFEGLKIIDVGCGGGILSEVLLSV